MASAKKNLVKEGTSTTGTGTLTLTAMTGWARFGSAYAVSDVVPYAIENGDNKEVGLGTVGASNTLARTTVLATLVAGVYDDTSPVAITLSGDSTVHSGSLAELFTASEISGLGTAATANTGTSGHVLPYLDGANTWSGQQTFTNITTSLDPGGTNNAGLEIGSTGGASNSYIDFHSGATATDYDSRVHASGGTGANGGGTLGFECAGVTIGAPTGGAKGTGTINAKAVYDDNVLLTCYAIDAYKTGSVDIAYWDSVTPDLEIAAQPEQAENRPVTQKVMRTQRVRDGARIVARLVEVDEPVYDELPVFDEAGKPLKGTDGKPLTDRVPRTTRVVTAPAQPARTEVRTHAPAALFAPRAAELLDPKAYGAAWKATGHLPAMPSPAEWGAADKKMGLGDIQQRLWETVECQAIHIDKLLARIEALEAR